MIVLLKYSGVRSLARPLGDWLAGVVGQNPTLGEADAIIPLPLHSRRQRARGFNQAKLIARELARWFPRPVKADWLARVKDTPSQTGLTHAQDRKSTRLNSSHRSISYA